MLRLCLPLLALLLSGTIAFGQDKAASPLGAGYYLSVGLPQLFDDTLSAALTAQGQAEVATDLLATGYVATLRIGGLETMVASGRTAGPGWSKPTGDRRTRVAVDATSLQVGGGWEFVPGWTLAGNLGATVTSLRVQTYLATATTWANLWAGTGQVELTSRGNWSPSATVQLRWRVAKVPNTTQELTVGLDLNAYAYLGAPDWKIADDVAITGLGTPWKAVWTPSLWVGFL